MVSAILAARHRTFVLVVSSLFVLFVFPMHNKFLLLLSSSSSRKLCFCLCLSVATITQKIVDEFRRFFWRGGTRD